MSFSLMIFFFFFPCFFSFTAEHHQRKMTDTFSLSNLRSATWLLKLGSRRSEFKRINSKMCEMRLKCACAKQVVLNLSHLFSHRPLQYVYAWYLPDNIVFRCSLPSSICWLDCYIFRYVSMIGQKCLHQWGPTTCVSYSMYLMSIVVVFRLCPLCLSVRFVLTVPCL